MLRFFLTLWLFVFSAAEAGAGILKIDASSTPYEAGYLLEWTDNHQQMAPAAVLELLLSGKGNRATFPFPDLGYTLKHPWFLLTVNNQSGETQWLLETGLPMTDQIDLYLFDHNRDLVGQQTSGSAFPFAERLVAHHKIISPVTLPQGTSYLLFQAKSSDRLAMPVTLYSHESFYFADTISSLWNGVLFGIIAMLCLYNLLIFVSTRDSSYFFYVLYLGTLGLFLFDLMGLAFRWLWPTLPDWNIVSLPSVGFFALGFSCLFSRSFLQLQHYSPRLNRILFYFWWVVLSLGFLTPFAPSFAAFVSSVFAAIWPLFIIYLSLKIWRKGYIPAFYFLLSFFFLGLAVTLYSAMTLRLLNSSWLLDHSLQFGVLLEAALLSFALAHRMNIIKRENARLQQETHQRLETKVTERTRELKQAMEARSQFLAVMSHEIRTPLNGILGTLDLLRQSPLNTGQKQQIHIIENSGNVLLHLIDDILDYSRIGAGKLTINKETFEIESLVNECLQLFQQAASLHGNVLTLQLDPSLPTHVNGDAMRIRQLIINLVGNAIKFTENGTITLIVKPKPDTNHIFFLVKDNGIGIAPDKQILLFDLFTQADSSTSRKHGGTGLGLAICRRLVLLMGGNIGVESEPGKGAIFWFHLPLPAAQPDTTCKPLPKTSVSKLRGRLLIVDDNHVNLIVTEAICKQLGFEVQTCEGGREAIALLLEDQKGFDAILMDCEMPGMDGFEATREISRLQKAGRLPAMPVAALTAHAVPDKIQACYEAGMVMHIVKPVRLDSLRQSLTQLLTSP